MKYFLIIPFLAATGLHWAKAQDSISVQEAVKLAIEKNYGVVLAKNEAQVSNINNNWGNAGFWPTIGFNSSYNYSNTNLNQELANGTVIKRNGVNNTTLNGSLAATWTVFDGMKMFATKQRLEELEKMGQTQVRKQILQTSYDVTIAYYAASRIRQQIAYIQEFILLLTEREKIAKKAFEVGSSAKTDWLQASLDLQEQTLTLALQTNELQKANANLNRLLARSPEEKIRTFRYIDLSKQLDWTALEAKLLSQNADWLLAQHNLAIISLSEKEIDSQKWPTLQMLSGYNIANSRSDAGFTLANQNRGPYAGLSLRVPILQGNTIRNQRKVMQVQEKSQEIAIESLKNDLKSYFYTARLDYQMAQQTLVQRAKNIEIAKENLKISIEQFKQKQTNIISLRQVQLNYQDAVNQFINAQYQVKQAEAYAQLLTADLVE